MARRRRSNPADSLQNDESEFAERLVSMCDVWRCLSFQEAQEATHLANTMLIFMRGRVRKLVHDAGDRAVMVCHMADGWGRMINQRRYTRTGNFKVISCTRQKQEFLLQRMVFRTVGLRESLLEMLPLPPRPMDLGKGSWNVFSGIQQCAEHPRDLGHSGLVIVVFLQDGALHDSSMPKLRAQAELRYFADDGDDQATQDSKFMASLLEWTIGIQCKAHACSNAVKWGITSEVSADLTEHAHIVVESLRNSSTPLVFHMTQFVQRHMMFKEPQDADDVRAWYVFLGLKDEILDLFMLVRPEWTGTGLFVSAELAGDPAIWEKVTTCLTYAWRWSSWSDTRWVKAGMAARRFILSLDCGIEGQVLACLQDADVKGVEKLHGWRYATPAIRMHFAVAAAVAVPVEQVLLDVLADDRLLRFAGQYRTNQDDKFRYISALPEFAWHRMSKLVGGAYTAADVRHSSISATATALGYMQREFWQQLDEDPLRMTQGNLSANIEELRHRDVTDPTTKKMKALLQAGVDEEVLISGLRLLRDAPCSTAMIEEAHACAAWLMREHPSTEQGTLLARSYLSQVRCCFMGNRTEKAVARLERQIDRLDRRCPEKVSERHLVMQDLSKAMCTQIDAKNAGRAVVIAQQECMKAHVGVFQNMDEGQKADLAKRRRMIIDEKNQRSQLREGHLLMLGAHCCKKSRTS